MNDTTTLLEQFDFPLFYIDYNQVMKAVKRYWGLLQP